MCKSKKGSLVNFSNMIAFSVGKAGISKEELSDLMEILHGKKLKINAEEASANLHKVITKMKNTPSFSVIDERNTI